MSKTYSNVERLTESEAGDKPIQFVGVDLDPGVTESVRQLRARVGHVAELDVSRQEFQNPVDARIIVRDA